MLCGEATVHLANYPDGRQHALITIKDRNEVLGTHQWGGVNTATNGVEKFDPASLPSNTLNVRVPLSNPQGAMAYVEVMIEKLDRSVAHAGS